MATPASTTPTTMITVTPDEDGEIDTDTIDYQALKETADQQEKAEQQDNADRQSITSKRSNRSIGSKSSRRTSKTPVAADDPKSGEYRPGVAVIKVAATDEDLRRENALREAQEVSNPLFEVVRQLRTTLITKHVKAVQEKQRTLAKMCDWGVERLDKAEFDIKRNERLFADAVIEGADDLALVYRERMVAAKQNAFNEINVELMLKDTELGDFSDRDVHKRTWKAEWDSGSYGKRDGSGTSGTGTTAGRRISSRDSSRSRYSNH